MNPTSTPPPVESQAFAPTFHLVHTDLDELSQLELLRLVQTGFFQRREMHGRVLKPIQGS